MTLPLLSVNIWAEIADLRGFAGRRLFRLRNDPAAAEHEHFGRDR